MKRLSTVVFLLSVFSSFACADPQPPRLEGSYRVQGECAYRAKNGEYKSCVAWNTLVLKKLPASNEYTFELTTSTFATTQGGCAFEGKLRFETSNGIARLVRSDAVEDECHLSFQVTPRQLLLDVPKSEEFEGCKSGCGMNSSLYSEPFPRSSRVQK